MDGFRAEPGLVDGKKVWKITRLDNQQIIAQGETIVDAVSQIEDGDGKCSTQD